MRWLALSIAALAVLILVAIPANASPSMKQIHKLCLVYDHEDSAGIYCLDDSPSYNPQQTAVIGVDGPNSWSLMSAHIGNGPRLVCMLHTARYYSKGYFGNSGLGCVPATGNLGAPRTFQINGTQIDQGIWWWNSIDTFSQGHLNCITWESSGAGVWCERGEWPMQQPEMSSEQINNDWWVNQIRPVGQTPLLCITWEGGDESGGNYCFRQLGSPQGQPTVFGTRLSDLWGINDVRIPGQPRLWCLAYGHEGNGGLSCFKDKHTLIPASAQGSQIQIGNHWSLWRLSFAER